MLGADALSHFVLIIQRAPAVRLIPDRDLNGGIARLPS